MEAEHTIELIRDAIESATANAIERFGETYASKHEAWAVLKEEVEEARFEQDTIEDKLDNIWQLIRYNSPVMGITGRDYLIQIKDHAEALACEAVQVAAVCNKYLATLGMKK